MAKGRGGGESKTRKTYMLKLAGEILTGEPMDNFTNAHMERGIAMEDEARSMYAFMTDSEPQQVGFIRNGPAGCSPDALIGDDGMLEIKTALPHILAGHLLSDTFPSEHKLQVMGQVWIAEREWCDICVYWPKMPLFVKRLYRNEDDIGLIQSAVGQFCTELESVVKRLEAMR
jgi:hypothetical protein